MDREGFVSLREIAQEAGVSVSAVSLALRNSPKISAARRREIRRLAAKMGYREDPRINELMEHLRKTRKTRSRSLIAVIVPELARHEFEKFPRVPALISGVRQIAASAGFGVDIIHLADPGMNCRLARSILLARGIKGIVVAPFASGVSRLDFNFEGFCASTAGYSIVEPALHRACPDYLRMMDGMLEMCVAAGCQRIGLVLTKTGGIGFKLFRSSFLYFQSMIPADQRIPMLTCPSLGPTQNVGMNASSLRTWLDANRPDVVIGAALVLRMLHEMGVAVPRNLGFVSIDVADAPTNAAGANHCYEMVGEEAFKLLLTALRMNLTGVPEHPRVVLVDSHQQAGFTLVPRSRERSRKSPKATRDWDPALARSGREIHQK